MPLRTMSMGLRPKVYVRPPAADRPVSLNSTLLAIAGVIATINVVLYLSSLPKLSPKVRGAILRNFAQCRRIF